jgi:hypothetical protein
LGAQAKERQGARSGEAASLKNETARLEAKPRRIRKECNFLKKAVVYFAKESE